MGSFGKTTAPASSSASSTTKIAASQASPSSDGTITGGHAYVWLSAAGSCSVALLLYADSSGAPGHLLATSDTVTLTSTTVNNIQAFTFSGAQQVAITHSVPYWYSLEWSDPGTPSVTIGRDSTASGRLEVQGFTFGSPPDPFGTGTAQSGPLAASIDYVPPVKTGTATATLGPLTAAATGLREVHGTAAATLAFGAAATGRNTTVRGTATANLGGLTAHAHRTVLGTATANLGALTAAIARGLDLTERPLPALYPERGGVITADPELTPSPGLLVGSSIYPDGLYPSEVIYPSGGATTVLANPAWPVVGFEVDFTQGPPLQPTTARHSINAPYRRLIVRAWSSARGRQYELDQVQAGTATLDIPDPLEMLNPDNPHSPFNPADGSQEVTLYRAMCIWAMWPNQPDSGNIINKGVDSRYDPSFEFGVGNWQSPSRLTLLARTNAQVYVDSFSMVVHQAATGREYGATAQFATAPGLTYTFTAFVQPTAGCEVRLRVIDAEGGVAFSEPATTSGVWQRLAITWTAVDALETITIYGSSDGPPPVFYVDATQLEFGDQITAFRKTGPKLYPIYNGYIERWPTSYDMAGMRALRPLQCVDALAILAQTEVKQTYAQEVLADKPVLAFPLDNLSSPASALQLGSGFGAGGRINFLVSSNGSVAWGGDQLPDGSRAVVFTAQNPTDPPERFGGNDFTEMAALGGAISLDTVAGFSMEVWAKWTSGTAQVGTLELIAAGDPRGLNLDAPHVGWASFAQPRLEFFWNFLGGTANARTIGVGPGPDGEWHHLAATMGDGTIRCYIDGVYVWVVTDADQPGHLGMNTFYSEASAQYGVPQAQVATARFAVYNGALSAERIKAHYDRGTGFVGELSGARVTRLLTRYWGGPSRISPGRLRMSSDLDYDTRTVLDVLQEIASSERGLVYADRSGVLVVEDRTARYAGQEALWVFGENPAGVFPTEYPYSGYQTDHDPTYVFTEFDLTRPDNSDYPPITNDPAEAKFGQRVAQQEIKTAHDFDLDQAGIYYMQRYGTPRTRIATLTLDPAANPDLWPVVLSLEISQRIRVTRRTTFTYSAEYYIEKIAHSVDAASGKWTVDLQCSPVFVPQAWVLGDTSLGVLGSTTTPVY